MRMFALSSSIMERQAALSICQRLAVLKLTMAEVPIDWIDHRRVISQLKGENTANANCRYAIYVSGWHNALSLLIKMVAAKTFFRHVGLLTRKAQPPLINMSKRWRLKHNLDIGIS